MKLNEKQINTFFDTLIKIIEEKEKVKIDYSIKQKEETKKDLCRHKYT